MDRLPHGYTNESAFVGDDLVVKKYVGSDSQERCKTEQKCLKALLAYLPVPKLVNSGQNELVMERLPGHHGQDLIDEGHAEAVLETAGVILRHLHKLSLKDTLDLTGYGAVLVHGDFGPQNLLLTEAGNRVTGLLDWEWAHFGDPIEDLAWTEWVVRTHHADHARAMTAFFDSYGQRPSWVERQASMERRCNQLAAADPVERGAVSWADRVELIGNWNPLVDD